MTCTVQDDVLIKDPDAKLDFRINWAPNPTFAESGDTIATSTWTTPAGIDQDHDTHDDTTATIWLTGGTTGTVYPITNRITTAGGRIDDQTIRIYVTDT